MQVQRLLSRVENGTLSIRLPESFNHHQVEVIVLTMDESHAVPGLRQPHPDIAGQVRIRGDVLSSVPESDWDLPQ